MEEFESPLEHLFHDQLLKRLPCGATLQPQVPAPTRCGMFRLDMLATVQNRRIGFEVDGREYHNEYRDEWRDAMILGDGHVDEIIRFRGCDLAYHLDDCFFLLSKIQPLLFSDRQADVIKRLASNSAERFAQGKTDWRTGALVGFTGGSFVDIRRRTVEGQTVGRGREFWAVYYRFAAERGGGSLDHMIEQWQATDRATCRN